MTALAIGERHGLLCPFHVPDVAETNSVKSLDLRWQQAVSLADQGADSALHIFDEIARECGDSPQLVLQSARALHLNGRDVDAEARLESGLQRWPTEPSLHIQLA